MHKTVQNILDIQNEITNEISKSEQKFKDPKIIAVSKTFQTKDIMPLVEFGHIHFGENKVQEALDKWLNIKQEHKNIKLHLIGKLQSNKVKKALEIFDYIHSLDNEKLAKKIADIKTSLNLNPKLFIQVNIGNEPQKSGVPVNKLEEFKIFCQNLNLNIEGIMCIPPANEDSEKFFSRMSYLKKIYNFNEISMGMSGDYILATKYQSTFLRIGTSIFGERSK